MKFVNHSARTIYVGAYTPSDRDYTFTMMTFGVRLKIDAGNGRLLAATSGAEDEHKDRDEEKHSSWKFWERDDEGKGKAEND